MKGIIAMLLLLNVAFGAMAQDTITFNKTYDFNHGYESGKSVITLDDGYLICGSGDATEYDGWWSLKLLKTDMEGNVLWRKVYGKEGYSSLSGWYGGMINIGDGFVLAAGVLDSGNVDGRGIIYRFNSDGDTLWTRTYNKPGFSFFNSIRQTSEKGYIIVGNQNISGIRHYWLMKTDSMGVAIWDTTLGIGYATTIEVTQDGGYIIGGAGGNNLSTARIVKTDSMGNVEWTKQHFGGNPNGCYWAAGIASDGGYYIWGCWDTVIDPTDFYLTATVAKLDIAGNRVWTNHYRGLNNKLIAVYQVKELADGNIMIAGEKATLDILLAGGWIVKSDPLGRTIWEKLYVYKQDSMDPGAGTVYDFHVCEDGGYIYTGTAFNDIDPGPNFNYNQDIWLLKLDSLGNWYAPPDTTCPPPCDTTGITETTTLQARIYPNPTTGALTIELPGGQGGSMALYNFLGQNVYQTTLAGRQTTLLINLSPGIYLYRITATNGQVQTGKVVVE